MTNAALLAFLRAEYLDDNVSPYLWSDNTLYACLAEAERQAVARTELIKDRASRYLNATDIAFDSTDKKITSAGSLTSFTVGMTITVYGSVSNDGSYTVAATGTGEITVSETLVDEAAGNNIWIYSPLNHVLLKHDTASYATGDKILRVLRAKTSTATQDLILKTEEELTQIWPDWRNAIGNEPTYLLHRESELLFVPKPYFDPTSTVVLVSMEVARYPLVDISSTGSPEVPAEYHMRLLDGAAAIAYSKQDAETIDNNKMISHSTKFDQSFGPVSSAKALEYRKRPRNATMYGKEYGAY